MHPIRATRTFHRGEAYWRVVLTNGRVYSELDTSFDLLRGKRHLDWHLDICATGDVRRIAELWLHTPIGDVALRISEPQSAYIFNSSFMSLEDGRTPVAKIIGRVDEKASGTGVAFIWDVAQNQIYRDEQASVLDFAPWRPGIARIGALNLDAMGVVL